MGLENKLFLCRYINSRHWLEQVLHENFTECGRSGRLFGRAETIESLLRCTEDRDITITDFSCRQIDRDTWLAHYRTRHDGRPYYRTSVWVWEQGFQMLYHQASPIKEEFDLLP